MKQMKITIEMVEPKSAMQAMKDAKKPKTIKSLKDLKELFENEDEKLSYGEKQFGASHQEINEETSRNEGDQTGTPDDKALKEDPAKRIKNSKHPTVVGKKMV